jgi:hypothetical protein
MFRVAIWMLGVCILLATASLATASDLRKIDRTIRKEPEYKGKPQYALLVFGPEAKTRVWVVQDGETLYVDRNGDGDLTGKDERFTLGFPIGKTGHGYLQDCKIKVRNMDTKTRYVFRAIKSYAHPTYDKADAGRHLVVYVDIEGRVAYRQYCSAELAERPDKAAISHFHGPLMIEPRMTGWKLPREWSRLPIGDSPSDISAVVGTMDAEHDCWVVVCSDDLPKDLHPVMEVEYPAKKAGDAPIKQCYEFKERC